MSPARRQQGQRTAWIAWSLLLVATGALGSVFWMVARDGFGQADSYVWPPSALLDVVGLYGFAIVGVVLAARRPRNPIGWLFLVMGTVFVAQEAASQYAGHAYAAGAPVAGVAVVVDWFSSWLWALAFLSLPYLFLLFPDGRLPGRRWRMVGWLTGGAGAVLVLVVSVTSWRMRSPTTRLVNQPDEGTFLVVLSVLLATLGACLLAGVVSLVVRFRRSLGVERQQLRWIAAASVAVVAALLVGAVGDLTGARMLRFVSEVGGGLAIIGLPVAVGFAVLRYRLYELDRIISRVVSYGVLTLLLVGVYAAGVFWVGGLVRGATAGRGGDVVVAASTLAVAAAFLPLRARIQRVVDRRFNRARYDAQRTVEAFAQRLRDEVDLATLVDELGGTAAAVLHPRHVSVWVPTHETDREEPT
jgi:hypothetical protein